jgi:hypothetical protein
MPALALSRVGALVVESGPDGESLAAGTWQRLEALPDPPGLLYSGGNSCLKISSRHNLMITGRAVSVAPRSAN